MICGREIKARMSSLRALICGFKSIEGISLSKIKKLWKSVLPKSSNR